MRSTVKYWDNQLLPNNRCPWLCIYTAQAATLDCSLCSAGSSIDYLFGCEPLVQPREIYSLTVSSDAQPPCQASDPGSLSAIICWKQIFPYSYHTCCARTADYFNPWMLGLSMENRLDSSKPTIRPIMRKSGLTCIEFGISWWAFFSAKPNLELKPSLTLVRLYEMGQVKFLLWPMFFSVISDIVLSKWIQLRLAVVIKIFLWLINNNSFISSDLSNVYNWK